MANRRDVAKSLGQVIIELRESVGLSQTALARAAKIDPAILSRLESGARDAVQFATLCRLAQALGVSLDDVAGATGLCEPKQRPTALPSRAEQLALAERLGEIERLLERALASLAELKENRGAVKPRARR